MTTPVPRVRREEVRRRLLDAAAEVFAERGYEAARLDEIAHAAGFTKGAVYSNFAGKPALLAALIEQQARKQLLVGAVEVRAQNRPGAVLDHLAEVVAREIVEQSTWSRLHVEIAQRAAHDPEVRETYVDVRRSLRDQLATTLAAGCARLGVELTVPAEQLALTLQALRLGLALEHGTDPEQVDRATVTSVVASTLRGVLRGHTQSTVDPWRDSA
ncbi:TetR/AcrR family transcriptional regulator [Prauserella cavernicola]|uniref:TetR/AcrR family transcriptional regulator n=1 Tax=Prauserella cavernicola TaxID=2800127 RepID=A0A934QW86_9PSEU|nr:TetR/AcrR family transcriptional regulator [Prauserella cavernicola]MBK1787546.1 TetR/AcrR family transcriptional regulator [Prauserella cavernicola]